MLASLFFGQREIVIKKILQTSARMDVAVLTVAFITLFPLMVLAFGLAIPSGMFVPSIVCGSLGGALLGKAMLATPFLVNYLNESNSSIMNHMALVGAVALLGGIQRSTVSLCVIIMEGSLFSVAEIVKSILRCHRYRTSPTPPSNHLYNCHGSIRG